MNIENIDFNNLLLIGNAILLAITAIVLMRFHYRCKRLEAFWESPTGDALLRDTTESDASALQSSQRVEEKLSELQRAVTLMEVKSKAPEAEKKYLPINNAQQMAKSGASLDDLQKTCGLNRGEANLMMKLYGKSKVQDFGYSAL